MRWIVALLLVAAVPTATAQGPIDDIQELISPEPEENATADPPRNSTRDDEANSTRAVDDNSTEPPAENATAPASDEEVSTPGDDNATATDGPAGSPAANASAPTDESLDDDAPANVTEDPPQPVETASSPDPASTTAADDGDVVDPPLGPHAVGPGVASPYGVPVGLAILGAAAGGFAFAASGRARRWWPLVGAFFTRLAADRVLRHPQRRAIHALVGQRPGIRYRELADELGLAHGVLTHHLRVLEKMRFVVARRDAGIARFYHPGVAPRGVVLDADTESLLTLVRERRRVRLADAAVELCADRRDVSRRAMRLLDAGLVGRETAGRAVFLVAPRSDVGMSPEATSAPGRPCDPTSSH